MNMTNKKNLGPSGLIIILLLAGCALSPDTEDRFVLSEEAKEFCNVLMVDPDDRVKRLLEPYGEPDSVSVENIPNKHDPETKDEVHTAVYKDGKVVIYSVPHMDRNFLLEVTLTGKFWPDFLPRQIGKPSKEILEYFGEPNRVAGNDFIYYCSLEADQYLQFHISLGRLARLEIKGWVD